MKAKLLATAALSGLTLLNVASAEEAETETRLSAQYGNIEAFYGNIEAFYGNIEAFDGKIDPVYGNIEAFYGNIEAFDGDLDALYGNIEAFYGNIEAFYGNIEAFDGDLLASYGNIEAFGGGLQPGYGNIEAFYGNIEAFYGNIEAFYGNIEAFDLSLSPRYGNIEAFYGNIEAFYGNIEAFYGNIEAFDGPLTSAYGNIEAFWGNIEAFYGNIEAFEGQVGPLWGNIEAFYGNIEAFEGALDPNYGNIEAFYGNIEAFAGNLDASWGNIEAFYGNIEAFYGNIEAFDTDLADSPENLEIMYGNIEAFYGNIEAFWGHLEAFYGNIEAFWGNIEAFSPETEAEWDELLFHLGTFYNLSQDYFAIPVALETRTDFWQGFAKDVFEKYGIDPTDSSTLAGLSATDRAHFFVDWYDGLMQFSGIDRVDHWMSDINWSPALTQDHDFNSEAVIGLLDFGITDETLLTHDVVYNGGYATEEGDFHGSAVVSLLIAPHDGKSLMGIAPNASVAVYNPFDETKTASFEDADTGIGELISAGARIINMSMGVPDSVLTEDWAPILDKYVSDPASEGTIFVKAAGNDGVAQADDIDWTNADALERLLIVGAIDVNGDIAAWSNTPGEACALIDGVCEEANKLKYNFLVAPGEFILTSDGDGGVTRVSGTSFAAPLVSGTAALIHGAWPWWKGYGEETVDVILKSATDLGDEGVDSTYGWGLLNVEAALSPLDWDNLWYFYSKSSDGHLRPGKSARWIQKAYLQSDVLKLEENGAYVVALERVGSTFRDFRIPLSSKLYYTSSDLNGLAREKRFQRHLYQRFTDWANTGSSFGDTQVYSAPLGLNGDWQMSMTARPYTAGMEVRDGDLPFQTDIIMAQAETGTELRFGYGDGATRLSSSNVFGFYSDFSVETGGVNPLLGLASGGSYASASMALKDNLQIAAFISEASYDHSYIDPLTSLRVSGDQDIADYAARAASVSLRYQPLQSLSLNLDYTQLHEQDSLLGDQGSGLLALEGGAVTDAITIGSETKLPANIFFGTSATFGKTRATRFNGDFLSLSDQGIETSAFAIAIRKEGLFGKSDQLRLSLSQPLQVEKGALEFTALEVIDRETGELGQVTQSWSLDQRDRNMVVEAIYAIPVLDGMGELTAFTRSGYIVHSNVGYEEEDTSFGTRLSIRY